MGSLFEPEWKRRKNNNKYRIRHRTEQWLRCVFVAISVFLRKQNLHLNGVAIEWDRERRYTLRTSIEGMRMREWWLEASVWPIYSKEKISCMCHQLRAHAFASGIIRMRSCSLALAHVQ